MVDDFHYGNLLKARDALLRLVVVDEYHPRRRRLRERALEDGADEDSLVVHHGEVVVRVVDRGGAYVVDAVVFGEDLAALVKRRLAHRNREVRLFDEERKELRRRQHPDELSGRVLHRKRRLARLLELP